MNQQVNEFGLNMPMISVAPMGAAIEIAPAPVDGAPYDVTSSTDVPADISPKCDHINVFVDSAAINGNVPDSQMISVDLVLSVSIVNPENGSSSSYKIVKRLSLDKIKLALQVETETPYQVVEAEEDPAEVKRYMSVFYTTKRAREVAGLQESAGKLTFKVMVSHKDKDGNRADKTLTIPKVKDKAHARHVAMLELEAQKKQFPDAKITRVSAGENPDYKDV